MFGFKIGGIVGGDVRRIQLGGCSISIRCILLGSMKNKEVIHMDRQTTLDEFLNLVKDKDKD